MSAVERDVSPSLIPVHEEEGVAGEGVAGALMVMRGKAVGVRVVGSGVGADVAGGGAIEQRIPCLSLTLSLKRCNISWLLEGDLDLDVAGAGGFKMLSEPLCLQSC